MNNSIVKKVDYTNVQQFFSNFSQGNQMILALALIGGFIYLTNKAIEKGGNVSLGGENGFKITFAEKDAA